MILYRFVTRIYKYIFYYTARNERKVIGILDPEKESLSFAANSINDTISNDI